MGSRYTSELRAEHQAAAASVCAQLLSARLEFRRQEQLTAALDDQIRKHVSICLWHHSEAGGHKFFDVPFWSEGAIAAWKKHGKIVTRKTDPLDAHQHEHVFPQNETIQLLYAIASPNADDLLELLGRINVACIVTAQEHRRLHEKGNLENPWARYEEVITRVELASLPAGERPRRG